VYIYSVEKTAKQKITIAIDGWSSCGKSTLAKALAKELNYNYVDSGAMYRGVALYALRKNWVSHNHIDASKIEQHLKDITLTFLYNPQTKQSELLLNKENVEQQIRTLSVSQVVSKIAAIKLVRNHLVHLQQQMGQSGGIVMDGRDIGSVVFPNAELKLFVTADPEIRAERRFKELSAKGENVTIVEVKKNLTERDKMDTSRKESPLIQVKDAVVLDNSYLSQEEQLEKALKLVSDKLKNT